MKINNTTSNMAPAFSYAFTQFADDPTFPVNSKTLCCTHLPINSFATMLLIRATLGLCAATFVASTPSTSPFPESDAQSMAKLFQSVEVVINHLVKSRDPSKKAHSRTSELSRSLIELEQASDNFHHRFNANGRRDKRQLSGAGGFGSNGFQGKAPLSFFF